MPSGSGILWSAALFIAVICLAGIGAACAQEGQSQVEVAAVAEKSPFDVEDAEDPSIDEIVVLGQKTNRQLRREIQAAETEIIGLFNEANADDDYDIVCRRETRVGSQIPRTNCKARLYWDALSELAQDDEPVVYTRQVLGNPTRHAEVLRGKMLEFARSEPALMQALVKRKLLQRELDSRD